MKKAGMSVGTNPVVNRVHGVVCLCTLMKKRRLMSITPRFCLITRKTVRSTSRVKSVLSVTVIARSRIPTTMRTMKIQKSGLIALSVLVEVRSKKVLIRQSTTNRLMVSSVTRQNNRHHRTFVSMAVKKVSQTSRRSCRSLRNVASV